jgi:hypothetical protein
MSETTSESENPATVETGENESQAATVGENVVTLLRQASDLAGANSRCCRDGPENVETALGRSKKGSGVGTSGDRVGS